LAQYRSSLAGAIGFLAVLALSGCDLPTSGPRGEAIEWKATVRLAAHDSKPLPYCLVPVTPRVVDVVGRHRERLAGRLADNRGPTSPMIGVGDVLSVTLFESAAGGLFFPLEGGLRNGNFLTIPNQIVDTKGDITIPYAPPIKAAGRTEQQIQVAIVDALKDRALEPQAVVTVVERRYSQVTLMGDIGTGIGGGPNVSSGSGGPGTSGGLGGAGARIPVSLSGERVLDVIARAGGVRSEGQDLWVLMERHHKVAIAPFEALVFEPANNIYVQAQDTIYVYREPQTYLAFGATGRQAQISFDQWRLNMGEALAKAGGLLDDHAEPRWVFLYRAERQHVAQELDPRCATTDGTFVPVIYEVDLRDPPSLFLVTQFPMRNKDIIYISNSRSVESSKFFAYVRLIDATLTDPINTAIAAYALKAAINGTSTSSVLISTSGVGSGGAH
jgi:polysaccharide export outer membrane protein